MGFFHPQIDIRTVCHWFGFWLLGLYEVLRYYDLRSSNQIIIKLWHEINYENNFITATFTVRIKCVCLCGGYSDFIKGHCQRHHLITSSSHQTHTGYANLILRLKNGSISISRQSCLDVNGFESRITLN